MKTHTNIVVKYQFEIYANYDWPPASLLHDVLLEICHVTLVSYVVRIQRAELVGSIKSCSRLSLE